VQFAGARLDTLKRALFKENHPVEKVKRIGLGPLSLEGVPNGRYRLLDKRVVDALTNPKRPPKSKKSR
jgi:16S rRNA U516 pseudouridylate synthase RsuA-like enzyme